MHQPSLLILFMRLHTERMAMWHSSLTRMSISLSGFLSVAWFSCLHCRTTESRQPPWSSAKIPPVLQQELLIKTLFKWCFSVSPPSSPVLFFAWENGQRSASATQHQLVLSSKCSWRGSIVWRWGERGWESLCVTPAQTFLHASGCALHTRGLLLFSLHHLFPDGHRLAVALEFFHHSQTLLALQTKQQQSQQWPPARSRCESKGRWIFFTVAKLWGLFPGRVKALLQMWRRCFVACFIFKWLSGIRIMNSGRKSSNFSSVLHLMILLSLEFFNILLLFAGLLWELSVHRLRGAFGSLSDTQLFLGQQVGTL